MGWKWNDIRGLLAATGLFTEEQIAVVVKIAKQKKGELADTLGVLAREADSQRQSAKTDSVAAFQDGRASAFREVRDAVKP